MVDWLNRIWNIGNHITIDIQGIIAANIPSGHVQETCPFIYYFWLRTHLSHIYHSQHTPHNIP